METQSGASRLLNSFIVALCIAPILVIIGCVLLGYNEKRAVCDQRAIDEGYQKVKEVQCTAPAENGNLILFDCDVQKAGLTKFSYPKLFEDSGTVLGTGLQVKAQMLQCVESKETKKNKGGGGGTTTDFSYTVEYRSSLVDDSKFQTDGIEWKLGCGTYNRWPEGLPQLADSTNFADSATIGPYSVTKEFVRKIPLTKPLAPTTPTGWTSSKVKSADSTSYYEFSKKGNPKANNIGAMKVSFWTNDLSHPKMTVLGLNKNGKVTPWTAGKSWLCSGSTIYDLMVGSQTKDDVFDIMRNEASAMTVVLRILGFLLIWFACSRFMEPLGVLADCIPCIGPWLGDQIEAIACCISCFPACACSLGVIGVVYVAMRPLIGIPMLLIFAGTMAAGVLFKMNRSKNAEEARQPGYDQGGYQQPAYPQQPYPQQPYPPQYSPQTEMSGC